jgi:tryptophan-rich sensory protein
LRSPTYGFACIIALWISIAVTIFLFLKTSKSAAALLLPYIAWVSFAAALNFYIMILNL